MNRMDAGSDSGVADVQPDEEGVIRRHLAAHAHEYWAAGERATGAPEAPDIQLVEAVRRRTGSLYWYRVGIGATERMVIAKTTDPSGASKERLRLAGLADASNAFADEYQALRRIRAHFDALADPTVGHVPILDHVPAVGAIIMERVDGEPMSRLLRQHSMRRPASRQRLLHAARGAGRWLREFHRSGVEPAVVHRSDRDEFLAAVERYASHLAESSPADARRLGELPATVRRTALRELPRLLPAAVAHSDFAMRNVILEPSGRVVVLDTLARRQAPIYEDLATFVVDLRFSPLTVLAHPLAFRYGLADAVEDALLGGYFAPDPVPLRALRVYRVLVLLDRWAALLAPSSRTSLVRRPGRWLATRAIRREVWRAIAALG